MVTMRQIIILLTIGLVIGVAVGLILGWVILPVQVVDSPLNNLARRFQDDYTIMVAEAYQVDRDLVEALHRLEPLKVENIPQYVKALAERYISQQGSGQIEDIRTLVFLSCNMGNCTPIMQPFLVPSTR